MAENGGMEEESEQGLGTERLELFSRRLIWASRLGGIWWRRGRL
ncbi:MAG: hypothetical protein N2116_05415 [Armatimonadetes bacterium]|nr:hypothetical protein [Armatimonadota bacterium]